MSFWQKSTGATAEATMEQEGAESGKLVQIPDGTMLHGVVTDIEMLKVPDAEFEEGIYEYEGFRVTWNITEDGEYNGVNVRQAIRVMSNVNNKRDQALDVLAFMDLHMNQGRFIAAGEAPDVTDMLEAFANKPMILKIRAMAGKNEETGADTYNQWVSGVFRKKPEAKEAHPTKEAALAAAKGQMAGNQQKAASPNKPASPSKPAGPAVNKPSGTAAGGESPSQKAARLAAEAARLAAEEAAAAEAEEAARVAALAAETDDQIQQGQDGVNTDDDTPPLDY